MNLEIKKEKMYLKVVNGKVLKSIQVSGGKNLDGTYKPSGFLSVRLVKEAEDAFKKTIQSLNVKTVKKYPKTVLVELAKGFLAYEKWDKGDRLVAVITEAGFTSDKEEKEEKEISGNLPF